MNAPAVFIVGAPRSGTTLLRLMLDAHPLLAIPPETTFLPQAAQLAPGASAQELLELITSAENWPDFQLQRDALARSFAALGPFSVAEGLRAFYRLYAARFSKARWGDKTPVYALHLETLVALLPEARVVHLLRDGRDAAASLRPLWFAPSRQMEALARHWALHVRSARAFGRSAAHYREVRYEELVRAPAATLAGLCEFLDLPYDEAMLRHHERAPERLAEHQERRRADGSLWLSREERLAQQRSSLRPPEPSRIGRFHELLSESELDEFEQAEGELLRELGYGA